MNDNGAPAPTTARHAAFGTGIAIVGAVCGTLLSAAFDGTENQKLLGATLGAVVGTLFSVAGPYLHLRAAMGTVVTGVALVVTYGGATVTDRLAGTTTFPVITLVTKTAPEGPPPTYGPGPDSTCEGTLCISALRQLPYCVKAGCENRITVTNTGKRRLGITDIEIDGSGAAAFRYDGKCAHQSIAVGLSCVIAISVVAVADGNADLVIHQNLAGPATRVALNQPGAADQRPNLRMSGKATCTTSPAGSGRFVVKTAVRNDGPSAFDGEVAVRVAERGGLTRTFHTTVGDVVLNMPTDLSVADRIHTFTVTVDPEDKIDETDERNNVRLIVANQTKASC